MKINKNFIFSEKKRVPRTIALNHANPLLRKYHILSMIADTISIPIIISMNRSIFSSPPNIVLSLYFSLGRSDFQKFRRNKLHWRRVREAISKNLGHKGERSFKIRGRGNPQVTVSDGVGKKYIFSTITLTGKQ